MLDSSILSRLAQTIESRKSAQAGSSYVAQLSRLMTIAGRHGRGLEVGSYTGGFLVAARDAGWTFDGLDVNFNLRLPRHVQVQGGTSTGRSALDFCDIAGRPDVALLTAATSSQLLNPYPSGTLIPNNADYCNVDRLTPDEIARFS